jgi:two-component system, OmpR family, phosphate regulon sensor histidine kinase PhoR
MTHVELKFDLTHLDQRGDAPGEGFSGDILLQNARWFTRIRWAVIAVFFAAGMLIRDVPAFTAQLSMVPSAGMMMILAGGLAGLNLVFIFLLRPVRDSFSRPLVMTYTWLQILADLVILTVLVHEVGSTDSFIVFAYLFHIVLSCIFFVPKDSFLVTVLAAFLFLGCRTLETTGILAKPHSQLTPPMAMINVLSAVFVWFVVWYLTSTISKAVRARDHKLAAANELLIAADREKNLLMLRTTHDLKAPFSGIETNIEMLKMRDWDALPETARDTIKSIEVRAATLRERINDILLLGELRTTTSLKYPSELIDLNDLLSTVISDLSVKADQRRIFIRLSAANVSVVSSRKQLSTLFSNLIANAILYSHEESVVEVTADRTQKGVCVKIADHGIGISDKAMPHIFEEYYRAPEAAQFNQLSTGLGLAIVKYIAQVSSLRVSVASEQGKGTTFEVVIPYERR